MITVVVPYFKNAKEIKRSLTSVFKQTYQNFEVLIINDASPDWEEALPIINSFSDARVNTISHANNKNGAEARNTGIKGANGAYVAFLDADDEWLPTHLEDALRKMESVNADMSYCQAHVYTKHGKSIMPSEKIGRVETISNYLFCNTGFIQTSTLMIRTDFAIKVPFNEKLRRHQDYDFLLRCEESHAKLVFVDKPNVIVHWENNNPKAKGGTWDFSLQFALDYKKYFTPKAYSRFILKNCVLALIEEKKKTTAVKIFSRHINPTHLNKLNYYFILSYLLFGEFKHPYKWKK